MIKMGKEIKKKRGYKVGIGKVRRRKQGMRRNRRKIELGENGVEG